MEQFLPLFLPFVVTLALEGLLVWVVLWRKGNHAMILLTVLALHCFTHPLGAVIYYFTPLTLLFAECTVTLLEAMAYRVFLSLSWHTAIAVSLVANVLSFFLGPTIRSFIA